MIYRMKEYDGILQRKYRLEIRHYVVYLGIQRMNMRTQLENKEVFRGFDVLDVSKLKFDKLIHSQIPEEIILAILSDFGGEPPEEIIRSIIEQLKTVSKNRIELKKYISQLQVFSQLRKLDSTTDKIYSSMPLILNLEENALFKRGVSKGIEKNRRANIIEMINDGVSVEKIAQYTNSSISYVIKIQTEINERPS